MEIHITDMPTGYAVVLDAVQRGQKVAPRGIPTLELLDATIVLEDPAIALPLQCGRKLNTAIAAAEALQLISGRAYPQLMKRITSNFGQFFDGEVLHGSYGPRLRYQIPKVLDRLREDEDTRQAVATIWDPAYDGYGDVKDTPCTTMLQWTIRNGKLNMHTRMRSNDVWWGLAYDAFQFTQLQINMAATLGVGVGRYYHHVTSLHIYERDLEAARAVTVAPWEDVQRDQCYWPLAFEQGEHWSTIRSRAQGILDGTHDVNVGGGRWYCDTLEQHVGRA